LQPILITVKTAARDRIPPVRTEISATISIVGN
jgi:hypothetical protein